MKIWLTQIGEILPLNAETRKMRSGYLSEQLSARGHEVIWWASAFDHMQKKMLFLEDRDTETRPGLCIRALNSWGYSKNISLRRYLDHMLLAEKMAKTFLQCEPPDIIIASMPDHWTAYQAARYALRRNIPILVDVRDEWPDIFLNFFPSAFRSFVKKLLFADYHKITYLLKNATGITSMMQYMLEWALTKAEREKTWRDRVFYIGSRHAARPSDAPIPDRFRGIVNRLNGQCVVTFIGTMGSYYNPMILKEVAAKMKDNKVFFIIAGDGVHFESLQREARTCDNILLPGWLSEPEIQYLLSLTHIGVIPCTGHIDTFPNKAYTYMSAGLPIISSVKGELGQLIENRKIGYTYPVGDQQILLGLINELANNVELRQEMSRNAEIVFKENYNADVIYNQFAQHVEYIAQDYGSY